MNQMIRTVRADDVKCRLINKLAEDLEAIPSLLFYLIVKNNPPIFLAKIRYNILEDLHFLANYRKNSSFLGM